MIFRDLTAEEIECRIAMVSKTGKGLTLLLYKDARCDQIILDETVGPMNWQRHHTRDNANCIVSIWDEDKKQWVSKEDTGKESNTEAEKGLASDSFKRACFNWGIGRELYTAPFIWIPADKCNIEKNEKGKFDCRNKFDVTDIKIKDKKITALEIVNTNTGKVCYTWKKASQPTKKKTEEPNRKTEKTEEHNKKAEEPVYKCEVCGKVFTEMKDRKGKIRSAKDVYDAWKKASPDGVCRCGTCKKKFEAMQVVEE